MSDVRTGEEPSAAPVDAAALPRPLRRALEEPPVPPRSWKKGIGPALLALGLSVVFLDRLPASTLMVGGLGPSAVGAVFGGLIAYWCLYYAPAMWGATTRRPLAIVASSTFGTAGAVLVPGVLLGVVYVVWFAVTLDYAIQYSLAGVSACGLLDPSVLNLTRSGAFLVPSGLFLFVAALWAICSAVIGTLAIRLVSAVMAAYVVFPALTLAAATAWAMPGVRSGPIETFPLASGGARALANMVQLVFAFLACHGLTSADWGAASKSQRDVRDGGMAALMGGIPVLAILSLLIVAGALGRDLERRHETNQRALGGGGQAASSVRAIRPGETVPTAVPEPTLRDAFLRGIGGPMGGAGLLVLALGLLGPACSTPFVVARQFSRVVPAVPRWVWSLLGAIAAWPLIASGFTHRAESVFALIGMLTAPVVGAIAADFARHRGAWPGPRPGISALGMAAWLAGVVVAGVLAFGPLRLAIVRDVPSSVAGFAVAFGVFALGARGVKRPAAATEREAP